jgi:hypothetical protein
MRKSDFENAIARQLIFMYDHNRGQQKDKGVSYDLNKCKHLACSEVRAALFTDHCKVSNQSFEFSRSKNTSEKFDAQKYCFKNVATNHLKEKTKCADRAEKYIDYVFDQCI